jgi:hypothetical protein
MNPGTRVFALSHTAKDHTTGVDTVWIFGFGVYQGDFVFEDTTSTEPMTFRERCEHNMVAIPACKPMANPRILLDNGKFVWGCECWWGPEGTFAKRFQGWTVVEIDIDESRKNSCGAGVPSVVRGDKPRQGAQR